MTEQRPAEASVANVTEENRTRNAWGLVEEHFARGAQKGKVIYVGRVDTTAEHLAKEFQLARARHPKMSDPCPFLFITEHRARELARGEHAERLLDKIYAHLKEQGVFTVTDDQLEMFRRDVAEDIQREEEAKQKLQEALVGRGDLEGFNPGAILQLFQMVQESGVGEYSDEDLEQLQELCECDPERVVEAFRGLMDSLLGKGPYGEIQRLLRETDLFPPGTEFETRHFPGGVMIEANAELPVLPGSWPGLGSFRDMLRSFRHGR